MVSPLAHYQNTPPHHHLIRTTGSLQKLSWTLTSLIPGFLPNLNLRPQLRKYQRRPRRLILGLKLGSLMLIRILILMGLLRALRKHRLSMSKNLKCVSHLWEKLVVRFEKHPARIVVGVLTEMRMLMNVITLRASLRRLVLIKVHQQTGTAEDQAVLFLLV